MVWLTKLTNTSWYSPDDDDVDLPVKQVRSVNPDSIEDVVDRFPFHSETVYLHRRLPFDTNLLWNWHYHLRLWRSVLSYDGC